MRRTFSFAFALCAVTALSSSADAHFILQSPPSWLVLEPDGTPQKLGPCGDEDDDSGAAVPSNIVTAYQVGDTVTITIDEVVFHPGHYRVALAVNDRSELPAEPLVTAGNTPCGTVPIMNPAVFPVLADDVFDHTQPFSSPQTTTIKLPSNVTCTHCTLQIIEFMSDHGLNVPGGCFYHHCADISVGTDAGTPLDAQAPPQDAATKDASNVGAEPEPQTSGCNCDITSRGSPLTSAGAIFGALAIGLSCAIRASRRRKDRRPD
jgi:hypothetical protein